MKIPDDIVEQIRSEADIVDIVGEFVQLKQKGRNFWGLCPFHNEKTPSFTVSPDKNIFKCFGCGKAGNPISFIMEVNKLTFPEALEVIAKKMGIIIPEEKDYKGKDNSQRTSIYAAHEAAADFFAAKLKDAEGAYAYKYFLKRNFSSATIDKFKLGYSPNSWDSLSSYLKKNFDDKIIIASGLVVQKKNGSYYDRFRNMAMFPIRDQIGKIIGFGGRSLEKDHNPKYLNSPQTLIYDKSKVLYGIFEAKNAIRNKGSVILCEGYADVITLHQAGIENAVATSGTAITNEHLKAISRFAQNITFAYDGDKAGVSAAVKGIELSLPQGFSLKAMILPEGEDPDSVINKFGKSTFDIYFREAKNFVDFRHLIFQNNASDSPSDKSEFAREILKLIESIPDRLQHDFYISRLAYLIGFNESALRELYNAKENLAAIKKAPQREPKLEFHDLAKVAENKSSSGNEAEKKLLLSLHPEELELLKQALKGKKELGILIDKLSDNEVGFLSQEARHLFDIIVDYASNSENILEDLLANESLDNSAKEIFAGIALSSEEPVESWKIYRNIEPLEDTEKIISQTLIKLNLRFNRKEREELAKTLKACRSEMTVIELLKQISDIDKKKELLVRMLNEESE